MKSTEVRVFCNVDELGLIIQPVDLHLQPATPCFNMPLDEFRSYQQWLILHYLVLPFKSDIHLLVIESSLPSLTIALL